MSDSHARQQRAVQNLAAALNECFDAASESTARKAAESAESAGKAAESARKAAESAGKAAESAKKAAESAEKAADSVKAELKADMYAMEGRLNKRMDDRLDRQDDTLRMIWTQCGGKAQRLPIDP